MAATLTPVIDLPVEYGEGPVLSDYFVEDFQAELPAEWQLDSGWQHEEGLLWSDTNAAVFSIPGEWPDLTLFLRFRISSDASFEIDFDKSEWGVFRMAISATALETYWEPIENSSENIPAVDLPLDENWHDLVFRLEDDKAEVFINGLLYHKFYDAIQFPRGGLRISNTGNGLVEINRLDIAPPGVGPGLPTPTSIP
ncbi:MAG: hypothetical protein DWQ07_22030 [Chloroflexi bacterium]|nr:MAG: hypothetical protein DWQ07_22030 [Chloroflexota bacterium]MBL1196366.1 hypothetical protein [Chloroflexota bacterium]